MDKRRNAVLQSSHTLANINRVTYIHLLTFSTLYICG